MIGETVRYNPVQAVWRNSVNVSFMTRYTYGIGDCVAYGAPSRGFFQGPDRRKLTFVVQCVRATFEWLVRNKGR